MKEKRRRRRRRQKGRRRREREGEKEEKEKEKRRRKRKRKAELLQEPKPFSLAVHRTSRRALGPGRGCSRSLGTLRPWGHLETDPTGGSLAKCRDSAATCSQPLSEQGALRLLAGT